MLVGLASADDGEARRQLQPLLRNFEPLPGRSWTEFPVIPVIATVLWYAGRDVPAVSMVLRSQDRSDDLSKRVVETARAKFYFGAMNALHHRRPDYATTLLKANELAFRGLVDLAPESAMATIMRFVERAATPPTPAVAPAGRPTLISLCVWGEPFIDAAARYFLPCCLAPGNVPELGKHGTVYLRINTRAEDVPRIKSLPVVEALSRHAVIDCAAIPETVLAGPHLSGRQFWNRMIFAALNYADLMVARSIGADFIPAVPDQLFSNRCYTAAKEILMSGYQAVVQQPIRAVASRIMTALEAAGCLRDGCIDVPSATLYRASLETIHPFIKQSFMRRQPTQLPVDPIQFYFPTSSGFRLHGFQLEFRAAATRDLPADLTCDFHTYDTRLLSDLLRGRDRDKAAYVQHQMPSETYLVTIDEEGTTASFGEFELSPPGSVRSIIKWINNEVDIDHFLWTVQQKFDFSLPPGVRLDMPADCADEDEAVSRMVQILQSERPAILQKLDVYRR